MAYIHARNEKKYNDEEKISMKFDIPMLNTFIKYLMSINLNKVCNDGGNISIL